MNGNVGMHLVKTKREKLHVLPGGERLSDPVDLLDSDMMRRLLHTLANHFDQVILVVLHIEFDGEIFFGIVASSSAEGAAGI